MNWLTSPLLGVRRAAFAGAAPGAARVIAGPDATAVDVAAAARVFGGATTRLRAVVDGVVAAVVPGARPVVLGAAGLVAAVVGATVTPTLAGVTDAPTAWVLAPPPPHAPMPTAAAATTPTTAPLWVHDRRVSRTADSCIGSIC
jgi:hypothetical protein